MPSLTTPSNAKAPPRHWNAIVLLALLSSPAAVLAAADDSAASLFSFAGFGTLGIVHSSEEQADFTTSIFKPNGAGYTRAWSTDPDSRIGAQVTFDPTAQLSAVLQVISEQNYDNTYKPYIEWANMKY
jgi:hypothetical protein